MRRVLLAVILLCAVCTGLVSVFCSWWDYIVYLPGRKDKAALSSALRLQNDFLWRVPPNLSFPAPQLRFSRKGAYFADIDYTLQRGARWEPVVHLDRLLALARTHGKGKISSDKSARRALLSLLDFWLDNDFQTKGWWYRTVKVPRQLLEAGIMLDAYLSRHQRRKLRTISSRGTLHPCQKHSVRAHTGANRLDVLANTLSYALFTRQSFLLLKTRALLKNELSLANKEERTRRAEGIQEDWAFFQHGPHLLSGSYGLVYADRAASMLELLGNASLGLPAASKDFLVDFLLYGVRYSVHRRNSHYLTNGRSFSRPGGESLELLERTLEALLRLCPGREGLVALRAHLRGEEAAASFAGTKYFPSSFFLASHWQGVYMAVKGAHRSVVNSEFMNGENPLGRNLGYGGVTTYQHTGTEYAGISSVWDFSMLPGSTAYKEQDDDLRSTKKRFEAYRTTAQHSDGRERGGLGALYVDLAGEDGLASRQFYVTDGKGLMVCLGTGITASQTTNKKPVLTTLDQTYARDPKHRNTTLTGRHNVSVAGEAVYNGAFAYYSLGSSGAADLRVSVESVSANFARNNRNFDQLENRTVFKIYVEHGTDPTNGSFAYAVAANQEGLAPPHASSLPIARVTNLHAVQSVEFRDGSGAVVLHKRGSSWLSAGGKKYSATTHSPALFVFASKMVWP